MKLAKATNMFLHEDAPVRRKMQEQYSRIAFFVLQSYLAQKEPPQGDDLSEWCDHIGGELYRKIFDDES